MKYKVVVPKNIQKKLQKFDKKTQIRIHTAFLIIESNPFAGKKLKGEHQDKYSLKVWPYRIIYRIIHSELVILIINIAHRQSVY